MKNVYFNSCEWSKESLLSYLRNHVTDGYKIIYHQNNILGLNITKMKTMNLLTVGIIKKLCFGTIPEVWDYYINKNQYTKYFLFFNFNVNKTSSKSVYAIFSHQFDNNELALYAFDKYHKQKEEEFGDFPRLRSDISNVLNCDRQMLFKTICLGHRPILVNPRIKLNYNQCVELEKRILRIK